MQRELGFDVEEEGQGPGGKGLPPLLSGCRGWRTREASGARGGHVGSPTLCPLTAMHCRMMQLCFIRPGPPNFFMSLQK